MNLPLSIKTSALVVALSLFSSTSFSQNASLLDVSSHSKQPSTYELKSSIVNFCKSVVKEHKSSGRTLISNKYLQTYSAKGMYYSTPVNLTYVDKVPFGQFGKGDLLLVQGQGINVVDYNLDAILKSSSEKFNILDFNYNKAPSNELIKQSHDGELYFQYFDLMKNIIL